MDILLGAGLAALTKVGLDAIGVSIQGIVGNQAHEVYRHFRGQITQRLLTGRTDLPENHDLRNAIEGSLRDACRFLAQCLAAQEAPKKPLLDKLMSAWREGRLLSEPLLDALQDDKRNWLKEFLREVEKPTAFGSFVIEPEQAEQFGQLVELIEPGSGDGLSQRLHEAMLDWLARKVQPAVEPTIAEVARGWITNGWSPDPRKKHIKVTFFQVCSLFFQERLKSDPRVAEIFQKAILASFHGQLASLDEHLAQLTPDVIAQQVASHLQSTYKDLLGDLAATIESGFGELKQLAAQSQTGVADIQLLVMAYGSELQEQGGQIAELTGLLRELIAQHGPAVPSQADPFTRPPLRAKPIYCFGREEEVTALVDLLLADDPGTACLLGPAGVGKSTISLEALHTDRVVQKFGDQRFFVECEGITEAGALWAEVAKHLGLPPGENPAGTVCAALQTQPAVIVLDNAETPWEGTQRTQVEQEVLAQLGAQPHCRLVISIRGASARLGVRWKLQPVLIPFSLDAARETFLENANGRFADEAQLDTFLDQQLDCLPLAVFLLARASEGFDTFDDMRSIWDAKKIEMLERPGEDHRLASLRASYELSLSNPRMSAPGRRLLSAISLLPDGIADSDARNLWSTKGIEHLAVLTRLGLVFSSANRKRMLAPLREYMLRHHARANQHTKQVEQFYLQLALDNGGLAGQAGGAEAIAKLVPESINIEAVLRRLLGPWEVSATRQPSKSNREAAPQAIDAAVEMGEFQRFTGYGTTSPLLLAIRAAAASCDRRRDAAAREKLGDLRLQRSDYDGARTLYEETRPLYEEVGDVIGQANCIKSLGDIALRRSDHDGARTLYEEARPLYEEVGSVLGQANCIQRLGDIALERSDHGGARTLYEEARPLFDEVGSALGQAGCIRMLGLIALRLKDLHGARSLYEEARQLYEEVGSVFGQATCMEELGDIALDGSDHDAARSLFEDARLLYEEVGAVHGQANCIRSLGDVASGKQQPTAAEELYRQALALYAQIQEPFSIGMTCHLLSQIVDEGQREEWIERARTSWQSIDRADLIEQHLDS